VGWIVAESCNSQQSENFYDSIHEFDSRGSMSETD
jgi:hypothetical protein